jgi:sec-independent protein translocase protein TatB
VSDVKADIDKEIKAEELKQVLEEQAKKANPLHEIVEETRSDLQSAGESVKQVISDTKTDPNKPQSNARSKS